jgi:hypothetical protein
MEPDLHGESRSAVESRCATGRHDHSNTSSIAAVTRSKPADIALWILLVAVTLASIGCGTRTRAQTLPTALPQPTPDRTMDAVVRGLVTIVVPTETHTNLAQPTTAPVTLFAPAAPATPRPATAVPPATAPAAPASVEASATPVRPAATPTSQAVVELPPPTRTPPPPTTSTPAATATSAPVPTRRVEPTIRILPPATASPIQAPAGALRAITSAPVSPRSP